jgi:chorismate mutase
MTYSNIKPMKDLAELRRKVDGIDDQIVDLIHERFEVTNEIGLIKAKNASPALDRNREQEILSRLEDKSSVLSLNPELIRFIYQSILSEVIKNHITLRERGG